MVSERFVPVAYTNGQLNRKDAEGEVWRLLAQDNGRFKEQFGWSIFNLSGTRLLRADGNNSQNAKKLRAAFEKVLETYTPLTGPKIAVNSTSAGVDPSWPVPPPDGLRIMVKLWGYRQGGNVSIRDNLWLTAEEAKALARGELPDSVKGRMARFYLVAHGPWSRENIHKLDLTFEKGCVKGEVLLKKNDDDKGRDSDSYHGQMLGFIESENGRVTRFDVVARGVLVDGGPTVRYVTFTLADPTQDWTRIPPTYGGPAYMRRYGPDDYWR